MEPVVIEPEHTQAKPLDQRSLLHIRETQLGADHPDTAGSLYCLAALYYHTQRYPQALSSIQRAVQIYGQTLDANHPNTQGAYSLLQQIQQAIDTNPD